MNRLIIYKRSIKNRLLHTTLVPCSKLVAPQYELVAIHGVTKSQMCALDVSIMYSVLTKDIYLLITKFELYCGPSYICQPMLHGQSCFHI